MRRPCAAPPRQGSPHRRTCPWRPSCKTKKNRRLFDSGCSFGGLALQASSAGTSRISGSIPSCMQRSRRIRPSFHGWLPYPHSRPRSPPSCSARSPTGSASESRSSRAAISCGGCSRSCSAQRNSLRAARQAPAAAFCLPRLRSCLRMRSCRFSALWATIPASTPG